MNTQYIRPFILQHVSAYWDIIRSTTCLHTSALVLVPLYWPVFTYWSGSFLIRVKFMKRPMVSPPVCLGVKHPREACDMIFISQTVAGLLMWGAYSDDRICLSFTIVAGLASAVILGSESRGTHNRFLLSQIREYPNLEGQFPIFIYSRDRFLVIRNAVIYCGIWARCWITTAR
jgi:hypothetical protein